MAWLVKYFPWVQVPSTQGKQSGMVVCTCNRSSRKAEAGGFLELTGQLVLPSCWAPAVVRSSVPNSEQDRGSTWYQTPPTHACTYVSPYTHRNTYICIHDNTPSPRLKKKRQFEEHYSHFRRSPWTHYSRCLVPSEEDLSDHILPPTSQTHALQGFSGHNRDCLKAQLCTHWSQPDDQTDPIAVVAGVPRSELRRTATVTSTPMQ